MQIRILRRVRIGELFLMLTAGKKIQQPFKCSDRSHFCEHFKELVDASRRWEKKDGYE